MSTPAKPLTGAQLQLCAYCPHPYHGTERCGVPNPKKPCKCKNQPGFWENLGNAIGEALFGGNR
jgi:hypothetical protein